MHENSDTLLFALEGEAPNSRASCMSPKNPTIAPTSPNLYPSSAWRSCLSGWLVTRTAFSRAASAGSWQAVRSLDWAECLMMSVIDGDFWVRSSGTRQYHQEAGSLPSHQSSQVRDE